MNHHNISSSSVTSESGFKPGDIGKITISSKGHPLTGIDIQSILRSEINYKFRKIGVVNRIKKSSILKTPEEINDDDLFLIIDEQLENMEAKEFKSSQISLQTIVNAGNCISWHHQSIEKRLFEKFEKSNQQAQEEEFGSLYVNNYEELFTSEMSRYLVWKRNNVFIDSTTKHLINEKVQRVLLEANKSANVLAFYGRLQKLNIHKPGDFQKAIQCEDINFKKIVDPCFKQKRKRNLMFIKEDGDSYDIKKQLKESIYVQINVHSLRPHAVLLMVQKLCFEEREENLKCKLQN